MLAAAGHDGMDLIDETDVWVTLNVGDADIVKIVKVARFWCWLVII